MSLKTFAIASSSSISCGSKSIDLEEKSEVEISLLELPELALEFILEKLPPKELCIMSQVCSSLRERCTSNHLWEKLMKQKWGKLIGPAAYREWEFQQMDTCNNHGRPKGFKTLLSSVWPLPWVKSTEENNIKVHNIEHNCSFLVDSAMLFFRALETGKLWFPAQVYNRQNGHVAFMLSCYDAEAIYDPLTDTFQARYPGHGGRAKTIEDKVPWERLRAPPVDTSPQHLHSSNCLNDLTPGDHFEIQWRRNQECPFGWWYGVVGHLQSCDGNQTYCTCHTSEKVVLEFHQYSRGSRWRSTIIDRNDHREEGNEADGYYGGIRKLYSIDEISRWKQLWPSDFLD